MIRRSPIAVFLCGLAVAAFAQDAGADPASIAKEAAQLRVRGGFARAQQIVEYVTEVLEEEGVKNARPAAEQIVSDAMAAQDQEEKRWPAVTDCDRLDRGFAALNKAGILARQNFEDCQTCGHGAMEELLKKHPRARGYTFFHQQDTESAVEGGGLYLAYGARKEGDAASVAVGKEVVARLKEAGLKVRWSGASSDRIHLAIDWKKRRFSRPGGE